MRASGEGWAHKGMRVLAEEWALGGRREAVGGKMVKWGEIYYQRGDFISSELRLNIKWGEIFYQVRLDLLSSERRLREFFNQNLLSTTSINKCECNYRGQIWKWESGYYNESFSKAKKQFEIMNMVTLWLWIESSKQSWPKRKNESARVWIMNATQRCSSWNVLHWHCWSSSSPSSSLSS